MQDRYWLYQRENGVFYLQDSNPQSFRSGLVIQFHQNAPSFSRGERLTVCGVSNASVLVWDERGRESALPLHFAARFQVYEAQTLQIAPKDKIRITQNGFTLDGKHRLNNGAIHQVKGFTKGGDLKLSNGWVIGKDYRNLAHGYCQTSHVAQSKTVDRVFVAQSKESLGASSAEEFYVSMSRARETVTIYTDDKARLAEAIQFSGARVSSLELLRLHVVASIIDPFDAILREKANISSAEPGPQDLKQEKEHSTEKIQPTEESRESQQIKSSTYSEPERGRQGISI